METSLNAIGDQVGGSISLLQRPDRLKFFVIGADILGYKYLRGSEIKKESVEAVDSRLENAKTIHLVTDKRDFEIDKWVVLLKAPDYVDKIIRMLSSIEIRSLNFKTLPLEICIDFGNFREKDIFLRMKWANVWEN